MHSTGQPCVVSCLLVAWKAKSPLPYKSAGSVGEATSSFASTFSSPESLPLPPTPVPAGKMSRRPSLGKILRHIGEPSALGQSNAAPSPDPPALPEPGPLSLAIPGENRDMYPSPVVISAAPLTPTSPRALPTLGQNVKLYPSPPESFHIF
ncbi:MAG: hypothetical protein BJ554DRAFT_549 [Olpidium bornovanus]|uniref:Uncharacterized protein n=1 Tax=Olpidium bornovanus TaxID=278681 RepID=A0A8H7ZTI8_9FUNG|nr:MAG: hypothetical protein BJ554DRAFT_549 [Olpidium bornovanus]